MDTIKEAPNATEYSVKVYFYSRAEFYFAYCPSLEIMLHSKNEDDLKPLFETAIQQFTAACRELGTGNVLFKLGWSIVRQTGKLKEPDIAKTPEGKEMKFPILIAA